MTYVGHMTSTEKATYLRNTSILLLSQAGIMIMAFLLKPVLARVLGPAEYGVFALVLSTAAILPLFTEFAAAGAVHYLAARYAHNPKIVADILTTTLTTTVFLYALTYIPVTYVVSVLAGPQTANVFSLAFIVALSTSVFYILQNVQQALEKFKAYSLTSFFSALASGLLALAGAYLFQSASASVILRASGALMVAIGGLWALRSFGRFDPERLKELVFYNAPLILAGVFSSFPAIIDRYLLTYFHTVTDVGQYDIAYTFAFAVMPFSSALLLAMAPRIVKSRESLPSYYLQISRVMALLVTLFALALLYFSDIIIDQLLGAAFQPAVPILQIICLGLPFAALISINSTSLTSLKKIKVAGAFSVLTAFLLFTLNFLLVKPYGSIGAAIASVGTFLVIASAGTAYLWFFHKVRIAETLHQWAIFFLFGGAYLAIEPFGIAAKILAYALFVLATYGLHRSVIKEMMRVLYTQIRPYIHPPLQKP